MKLHKSGEDYLEAILLLKRKSGPVRSVDLARYMGYSKASISYAVSNLRVNGYLTVDTDGYLHLTAAGKDIAEKVYERHQFFLESLLAVGVNFETADQEACKMEHAVSYETVFHLQPPDFVVLFLLCWHTALRRPPSSTWLDSGFHPSLPLMISTHPPFYDIFVFDSKMLCYFTIRFFCRSHL